jgi:cation transport regulator ChaB
MAGDDGTVPVPDPTFLTTEALARGLASERDYVDGQLDVLRERLRGIDIATRLLNETVNRVPTDVQREVSHLRELDEEKFSSVQKQFAERDTRSERESKDNKVAVDAAFAAQKEAAAKQDESNLKAIDKSEKATTETIKTLQDLFQTSVRALSDKIDDLKERVGKIESTRQGAGEARTERRSEAGQIWLAVGVAVAAISVLVGIYLAKH